jgi:beta-1,4-mannosyltransferase
MEGVAVVVLGDLGRSPRMLAHAESLAATGVRVDLVGYDQSPLPRRLAEHPSVTVHPIVDRWGSGWGIARLLSLSAQLTRILLTSLTRPAVILVQNPPAIPTLALTLLGARARGARLVLDWHNFGCSMLALRLGHAGWPVRLARAWETLFGRMADAHLCVTPAMSEVLRRDWAIPDARVLPDRPRRDWLRPECAAARARLSRQLRAPLHPDELLLITATSWSLDEDMGLCLDALADLAARRAARPSSRPLRVVLSGRGPGRDAFDRRVQGLDLAGITIETIWVDPEDYPGMLRAADLGLCFHRSASGVDFPMKIVDMRAAGLPVLAYDYGPSLRDEVAVATGGRVFQDAGELASHLAELTGTCDRSHLALETLRARVEAGDGESWEAAWERVARPLIFPAEASR